MLQLAIVILKIDRGWSENTPCSPAMAAAAIAGRFIDVRQLPEAQV